MSELTKQALKVENNQSFPNNNAGLITPSALRTFNENMIDSLVDEVTYNADSASWNQQIAALDPSGSAQSITALNAFTQSADQRLDSLEAATGSYAISSSVAEVDAAQQSQINSLIAATGSYVTSAITGSSLITASFSGNTLTFTKGDSSTFGIVIPDVSGSTINTGSFATTGSNVFVGNQTITGSLLITGSETIVGELTASRLRVNSSTSLGGTLSVSNDTTMTGDLLIQSTSPKLKLRDTSGGGFSSGYDLTIDTGSFIINDETHDRPVLSDIYNPSTLKHTTELTSEIIVISGSDSVTLIGNVSASVISASVITGLGSPAGFSASVDSRLDGLEASTSSLFTSASLGLVTASFSGNTLTFTKGDATTFGVVIPDVSGSTINTGSFATTGSNSFVGNQVITGSLTISSSDTLDLIVNGQLRVTGSSDGITTTIQQNSIAVLSGSANTTITPVGVNIGGSGAVTNRIGIYSNPSLASLGALTTVTQPSIVVNSSTPPFTTQAIEFNNGTRIGIKLPTEITGSLTISSSAAVELTVIGETQLTGSLGISGTITASLQEGFVLVGNSAGRTTTVATSSFGGGTDISSLNAFTASAEIRLTNLELETASLESSVTNLNAFTQSQQNLNGTFATTGSNTFVGNQTITGSLTLSSSAAVELEVIGNTLFTGSVGITGSLSVTPVLLPNGFPGGIGQFIIPFLSGSSNIIARDQDNALYWQPAFNVLAVSSSAGNTTVSNSGMTVTSNTTGSTQLTTTRVASNFGAGRNIAISGDAAATNLTGLAGITNPSIVIQSGSVDISYYAPIQFQPSQSFTDGRVTITRPLVGLEGAEITGSVSITGTLTASIQEGFVLAGGAGNVSTLVATSSFGGGGSTDISSLNAFTASQELLNTTFATTGSNNFIGNQTITGSLTISGSEINDVRVVGKILTTGSTALIENTDGVSIEYMGVAFGGNIGVASAANATEIGIALSGGAWTTNWGNGPIIYVNNTPGDTYEGVFGFQNKTNYTDGRITALKRLDVSGSVNIENTLTASLQQGYVWVGDANGRTTTVSTGSFGGGGGSAFPFTGSAQITGSLGITGSISEFVNTLTIASSTASVNFNDGNMFTLTLVTGSVTHITPTNIRRGQTINIQINQPAGVSSGSVSFSPNVLFAGGNDYQATATGSAIDLLTFVSLDGTNVLGTSIKNFL